MRSVQIRDDMIRLGQFLKLAGLAEDGTEAKALLDDDLVKVNGTLEFRRGRQLHIGDVVRLGKEEVEVIGNA
ncbi:RNA-binding S4 domain-containing protein [Saxibacter everestensis]|uniref:RNA-binding S4 domain-containing protein n=1 Tax=Saxibacter everestensis TaxID=2909229 RepID=A0ABY8QUC2_9MICO|nr:RNA-binding S4 domain-containing protein [Brevibacteriaceae bacterium ZFBP1038]